MNERLVVCDRRIMKPPNHELRVSPNLQLTCTTDPTPYLLADMLTADLLNPLPRTAGNKATPHRTAAAPPSVGRRPEVAGSIRPVGGYLVAERHPRSAVYRVTAPQLRHALPAPVVLCGI